MSADQRNGGCRGPGMMVLALNASASSTITYGTEARQRSR